MSEARAEGRFGHWLMIAACAVVVATVIAAIHAMGPPSAQRQVRLDERRVQDLQRIAQVVELHLRRHDALPPDLTTLASEPGQRLPITDPVDGAPYVYEVTGARRFRLCAVFATDTADTPGGNAPRGADDWHHGRGRQCFDRRLVAQPDRE